jgi:hypothetical protein
MENKPIDAESKTQHKTQSKIVIEPNCFEPKFEAA